MFVSTAPLSSLPAPSPRRPRPRCSPFPPREQLLATAVGGGMVVAAMSASSPRCCDVARWGCWVVPVCLSLFLPLFASTPQAAACGGGTSSSPSSFCCCRASCWPTSLLSFVGWSLSSLSPAVFQQTTPRAVARSGSGGCGSLGLYLFRGK